MDFVLYISVIISVFYFISVVFSAIGFFILQNKKVKKNNTDVKVSIVIAARNEEANLKTCLQSILTQNYKQEYFEVIVVNDHSIDNTERVVKGFNNSQIKLLNLTGKEGKKAALAYGVSNAQHEIILTTDADCIVPSSWIEQCVNNYDEENTMLIGPLEFVKQRSFLYFFQQLDMFAMHGIGFGFSFFKQPILNNAANLSFKKDVFTALNGYDNKKTPSGDDVFLLEKFKKNKLSIKGVLNYDFIVKTNAQNTFKEFINQRIRWSSKSKFYSDKLLVFLSITVLLENILQLFIYCQVMLIEKYRMIYIILLLSKWLIDFILLFLVSTFYKKRSVLLYFIPVQLIYPIYILGISLVSNLMSYEWKGRKY